jgi:2-dehydropantoate 2-reductase
VLLIARGAHYEAIRAHGLLLRSAEGEARLLIQVVLHPVEIEFRAGDVVLLAMKSNDTLAAVEALSEHAPADLPIVCLQNGVENERVAARRFSNVYAAPVRLPATHLEPGVVVADSHPVSGILDIGRYPSGADALCVEVSAALERATFSSRVDAAIMRQKYTKLWLVNLSNVIEAACGAGAEASDIVTAARAEAEVCFEAAGIEYATLAEDRARRGTLLTANPLTGKYRPGGSTWQSLARGKRVSEVDYLNGEIVLLGRLYGIPTPVNAGLQAVGNEIASGGAAPGSLTIADLTARCGLV